VIGICSQNCHVKELDVIILLNEIRFALRKRARIPR
jgi:hypothetical protein